MCLYMSISCTLGQNLSLIASRDIQCQSFETTHFQHVSLPRILFNQGSWNTDYEYAGKQAIVSTAPRNPVLANVNSRSRSLYVIGRPSVRDCVSQPAMGWETPSLRMWKQMVDTVITACTKCYYFCQGNHVIPGICLSVWLSVRLLATLRKS